MEYLKVVFMLFNSLLVARMPHKPAFPARRCSLARRPRTWRRVRCISSPGLSGTALCEQWPVASRNGSFPTPCWQPEWGRDAMGFHSLSHVAAPTVARVRTFPPLLSPAACAAGIRGERISKSWAMGGAEGGWGVKTTKLCNRAPRLIWTTWVTSLWCYVECLQQPHERSIFSPFIDQDTGALRASVTCPKPPRPRGRAGVQT